MSRNHTLTNYKEEEVAEVTVSTCDEKESHTYILRKRQVVDCDQQMQREEITYLRPTKRKRLSIQ